MRRSVAGIAPLFIALPFTALAATAALAQEAGPADTRVTDLLSTAKQVYGPPAKTRRCGPTTSDEIVVCGPDRGEDQRIPSTAQSDPRSRSALRTGVPRAPQLDRGSCKGQPNCLVGGRAPPPIYYIDLKAIPEAPEGSDADKVAKGEEAER